MTLKEPEYGSGSRAIPINSPSDIKYIRITDFSDDGIPPNHEFVTAETVEYKYNLEPEDILFARSGATAGKTFIYTADIGEAIFAGYCIRFQFNGMEVMPKFVYFYTKTQRYKSWVNSIQRPSGQPNINKEEFKSFTIPLPSFEIQRSLVAEIEAARQTRKQKLAQADELLSSLDTYLLAQLGLSAPEESDKKVFAVKLGKIKRGRLDPKFALSKEQEAGRFHTTELADLVTSEPEYGSGSRAVPLRAREDIKYIRITDFDDNGIPPGHEFVSAEIIDSEYSLEHEDILFARSGATAGKTFIYTEDIGLAIFAGYCIRFRFNQNLVLPWFVYFYTKTSLYKAWVNSIQRPSGQPNINKEEFKSFRIALPLIDVQRTLITEMQRRRLEAQQLRQEAETEWEVAKSRFECKLLGEDA